MWSATPVYQKIPEDVEIWEGTLFYTYFNINNPFVVLVIGAKSLCISGVCLLQK